MKRCFFLLFFLSIFFSSNAQTFINGCLITSYNPDRIYTSLNGGDYYITVCNGTSPSNRYAYATGSTGGLGSCNNGVVNGYRTSYFVALCPIDDYIPFILLATAGFGFFYLRGKKSSLLIEAYAD